MTTLRIVSLREVTNEAVKLYWQTKDHCNTQPSISGCIDQAKKVFRIFEGDLSENDELCLENMVRHQIGQGRKPATDQQKGGWWYFQNAHTSA